MFKKKKLYKIVYRLLGEHNTIIEAKDEFEAIEKFNEKRGKEPHTIVSFEEYKFEECKGGING